MEKGFSQQLDLDLFLPESKQILKDYKCRLCNGLYKDLILDTCGDIFCRQCFNISFSRSQLCPINKKPLKDAESVNGLEFINKILERQILYCKNREKGCKWFSTLSLYEKHLRLECLKEIISCTNINCQIKIQRENLEKHLNECSYRLVNCKYCEKEVSSILMNSHKNDCLNIKILCTQNCNVYIERCNLEQHIKISCPNTEVTCVYSSYGCNFSCSKKSIEDHYCKNTELHNLLVLKFLETFQRSFVGKIQNLEENVRELSNKLEELINENQEKFINKKRSFKINSNFKERIDLTQTEQYLINNNNNSHNIKSAYENNKKEELKQELKNKDSINTLPYNYRFDWDKQNTSSQINIIGNKLKCIFTKKNKHLFAFIDNTINFKTISWKVNFHKIALWIAIGVCDKEKVIGNQFIFSSKEKDFNHGCFVLSSNSYTWNANNPEENNKHVINSPNIKDKVELIINYNHIKKELNFSNDGRDIRLTRIESFQSLVPVVIMISNGDEISTDLITNF